MTTKASPKQKPSVHRQFEPGSRVSAAGGTDSLNDRSPLSDIVARIIANPALGDQMDVDAGIYTKTGRLKKSYSW
jgi:hypothetical protein